MGWILGRKASIFAVAAMLALGAASCGGGDDSPGTPTGSDGAAQQREGGAEGDGGARDSDGRRSAGSDDGSSGTGSGGSSADPAANRHDDSGGGAEQFRVRGGDNSVQEFGSEAGQSEFDEAAAAVHGFLDARVRGNWDAACTHLASDVAESLAQLARDSKESGGKGCPGILAVLSGGVPRSALRTAAKADIGSLRVEGDRGFVLYRGAQSTVFAMPLKKEDGSWKVASLAGTPIS